MQPHVDKRIGRGARRCHQRRTSSTTKCPRHRTGSCAVSYGVFGVKEKAKNRNLFTTGFQRPESKQTNLTSPKRLNAITDMLHHDWPSPLHVFGRRFEYQGATGLLGSGVIALWNMQHGFMTREKDTNARSSHLMIQFSTLGLPRKTEEQNQSTTKGSPVIRAFGVSALARDCVCSSSRSL